MANLLYATDEKNTIDPVEQLARDHGIEIVSGLIKDGLPDLSDFNLDKILIYLAYSESDANWSDIATRYDSLIANKSDITICTMFPKQDAKKTGYGIMDLEGIHDYLKDIS